VVQGFAARLGADHRATLAGKNNLVHCYNHMKEPAKAEPLLRELAAFWKEKAGADSALYAGQLAVLGLNLLRQHKSADAEPPLRQALAIRDKRQPGDWTTFNTRSMLGGALLGQKKFADAERLLVQGYEGMKRHEEKIPPQGKVRLAEALERLVQLYEATGREELAAAWRKKQVVPSP
jgi:hypothetical protein